MKSMPKDLLEFPPVTDELLQRIVSSILSVGSPLKIVLFGSRARGDARDNSDLDLLVIEDPQFRKNETYGKYRESLSWLKMPYDLWVTNLREVMEWRPVHNSSLSQILSEGRVLYQAGYERESAAEALVVREGLVPKNRDELVRDWLELGDNDLASAELLLSGPAPYRISCYLVQQSIEKYMKAFLAFHDREVPHIHGLVELLATCQSIEDFGGLSEMDLATLTGYLLQGRYNVRFRPDRTTAEQSISAARAVRDRIAPRITSEP